MSLCDTFKRFYSLLFRDSLKDVLLGKNILSRLYILCLLCMDFILKGVIITFYIVTNKFKINMRKSKHEIYGTYFILIAGQSIKG